MFKRYVERNPTKERGYLHHSSSRWNVLNFKRDLRKRPTKDLHRNLKKVLAKETYGRERLPASFV